MKPQTIQIFLPDGSPISIKEAELTNRLVKAVQFPRNKIQEVSKRELVHYTGVYFLFGSSDEESKPTVYIGEGEDCYKRIQSHNRKKDFWTHCVVVTTKTNEYTKTDAKFLEHYCLEKANQIKRYKTENDTGSKKPSIPEGREYDLLDNFETLKILLATLGYPIFEEINKKVLNKENFFCKGKDANAEGVFTDEGMLVMKGSVANLKETKTAGTWVTGARERLLKDGTLINKGSYLEFESDHLFIAPSTAAAVILARRANGWIEWKNKEGKTLDELKRKNN